MSRFMRWVRLMCTCLLQVYLAFLFTTEFSHKFAQRRTKADRKRFYRRPQACVGDK